MELTGIHHVTAVSANIRGNRKFYTETLGLRLVKRTVNQDDPSAYHLFYADAQGSPGTDLTFFDWPLPPERRGTRSIVRTRFRVNGEATLRWWSEWLRGRGVTPGAIAERDGRLAMDFEDPEGQRLTLIDDGGAGEAHPWDQSPVPAGHQIRGLGAVTLSVPKLEPTDILLQRGIAMRPVRTYPDPDNAKDTVHVYAMGAGGPAAEVHVAVQPGLPVVHPGAGGVHHVAFRTPTFAEHDAWIARLNQLGIPNSGAVDRFWFRSLYFREPNGILFEIATDGPGFATDEDASHLGERIVLAPFLEPRREAIVAALQPID